MYLLVADVAVVVLDGLQLLGREADVELLRLSKPRLVRYGFNVGALLLGLIIDVYPIFWVGMLNEDLLRDGSYIVYLVILVLFLFRR